MSEKPQITIKMRKTPGSALENMPDIVIELDPAVAPNTVANFVSLADRGYYDGLTFHRIIPGFMIQGGCPLGSGTGGPGYHIKGEFAGNDFPNPLAHTRGVISMARSGNPDSAGSQFFIMVDDASHLDGQYASFGQVISGMETADAIVESPRGRRDAPEEEIVMETVTVETFGKNYGEPKTD